ncbi:MAG TPA: MerR family DNA-binding transcriptional regulator, partial [Acidimicrobiia bacterium]|nr:MerR family DNA-binding transcriptional regulator [Acidimicrobiia bacterium]
MSELRIGQAADLLGVSADTVRRWADEGRLATT